MGRALDQAAEQKSRGLIELDITNFETMSLSEIRETF